MNQSNKRKINSMIALASLLLAQATSTCNAEQASRQLFVTVKPKAIMRSLPSIRGDFVSEIPFKSPVAVLDINGPDDLVLGTNGKWYKIKYKGKVGWVFNRLLGSRSSAPHEVLSGQLIPESWKSDPMPVLAGSRRYILAVGDLKLRNGPRETDASLLKIPYGHAVIILRQPPITKYRESNGFRAPWLYVRYKNHKGYAWAGHLSTLPPPPLNCRGLEHYLLARFNPNADLKIERSGKKHLWIRSRTYSKVFKYINKYGMNHAEETLSVPGVRMEEIFLLTRLCTALMKNEAVRYNKKGNISVCKTEEPQGSPPSGFEQIIIQKNLKKGVTVIFKSYAHLGCPR